MTRVCLCLIVATLFPIALGAYPPAQAADSSGIAAKVEGLERHDGLLTMYLDQREGKIWLRLPASMLEANATRFLYVEGLASGLGSNPVGLDRGQIGPARLVRMRRVGARILVEELNTAYRARSSDPDERRAVEESFATSVLWAGRVEAQDPDGAVLVDFTSFVVRDAHGTTAALERADQGAFSLDSDRSAVDLAACLAFPANMEFEAVLTFGGKNPGRLVRQTAPEPRSITLVQHHSILALPDDGYRPRVYDPRAGSFTIQFSDYAAPLSERLETRWIVRHRLEKIDPGAARSRVKEPIVYHVDRGAPEPVRSALIEGASWWAEAFEEAGFIDAFRVEVLPDGAHPLDARYNVIQWVHRSTRGWSYGGGVIDPRTGEMIKGHVSLGSLRVRQDRLLFEGLAGTSRTATGSDDDPIELALARIRQLSAHEVGHTLGFNHNFAASTYGRASVMDYPAPLIGIVNGSLDFSSAYAVGVGAWDRLATRYAYSQFGSGEQERAGLEEILREALDRGLVFLSDGDARPAGAANPRAALWDNGEDPVEALDLSLRVRRIALDRFGQEAILPGLPLAYLQEVLVPVYLHHRYQMEAAAKLIGGLDYTHAVRGDGQAPAGLIPPERQRHALEVILELLEPGELDLPESVLELLLPRPPEEAPSEEIFHGFAAPAFDPMAAAATAAAMALETILQPERTARLVDFHRRDPAQPGLDEILDRIVSKVFDAPAPARQRQAELLRLVQRVVVDELIDLAASPKAASGVRARIDDKLRRLRERLEPGAADREQSAHVALLADDIERYLGRRGPEAPARPQSPPTPPGSPIGEDNP